MTFKSRNLASECIGNPVLNTLCYMRRIPTLDGSKRYYTYRRPSRACFLSLDNALVNNVSGRGTVLAHQEASSPTLPKPRPPPKFRMWTSLNLLTQWRRSTGVILTKTMALLSSVRAFSAIFNCRSKSSSANSRKRISTACSGHFGAERALSASARDRIPFSTSPVEIAVDGGVEAGGGGGGGVRRVRFTVEEDAPVDVEAVPDAECWL